MSHNTFSQTLKWAIKDGISLVHQVLGRPHNRTRGQIQRLEAAMTDSEIEHQRISLIVRATNTPESTVRTFADRAPRQMMVSEHFQGHTMGLRDSTTLHTLICACDVERCVETGVAAGASSAIILQELERRQRGRLVSIDIQSALANHYGELIPESHRGRWELRIQREKPLLPMVLEELASIDFFLHDSRHVLRHMMWEYELAWRYLRPGGCLASHDVIMTTAFDDFYRKYRFEIADGGIIGAVGFWIKKK